MQLSKLMKPGKGTPAVKQEDEFDREDLNKGMQDEAKEHPWMDPKTLRRLVTDHLRQDEDYYETEEEPETDEEKD